jgi:bacterial/archaeal transporter family protein
VIGVAGGLLAALMWGSSTVAASRSTKALGSQVALAYVMLTGFVLAAVAAPITHGLPHANAKHWIWALVAGAASVSGLSCLYHGLRLGKVGAVAPLASTEGAFAALLSVAFLGQSLTTGVAVALGLVVCGVLMVTFHASLSDIHLEPSLWGIAAACLFGVGLVSSAQAGSELGAMWTILIARVIAIALLVLPLAMRGKLVRPARHPAMLCLWSGVAEVIGFTGYIIGAQHGVAVPAVLAAQFAAVAAILSYFLFGERLTRRQVAGACVIAVGVGIVAALSA